MYVALALSQLAWPLFFNHDNTIGSSRAEVVRTSYYYSRIMEVSIMFLEDADPILADFYVKYVCADVFLCSWLTHCYVYRFSEHAEALGVSATDLYAALLADAESQPPNWNIQGRQADIWKELGEYIAIPRVVFVFMGFPTFRIYPFGHYLFGRRKYEAGVKDA